MSVSRFEEAKDEEIHRVENFKVFFFIYITFVMKNSILVVHSVVSCFPETVSCTS